MDYVDTVSISLSTSVLFNYPFSSFARLPVSLTISLSLFSSTVQMQPLLCPPLTNCSPQIRLTPPHPRSPHPTLTVALPSPDTDFTLNLQTKSLMGSRAKLADVPKLHELITNQVTSAHRDVRLVVMLTPWCRYDASSLTRAHSKLSFQD